MVEARVRRSIVRATALPLVCAAAAILAGNVQLTTPAGGGPGSAPNPREPATTTHAPTEPAGSRADYEIDAVLDGSHRVIDANAVIRFTNRSRASVQDLWWHLYMNAFRDTTTLFMRSGGAEGHRGHDRGDAGRIDVTSLTIDDGVSASTQRLSIIAGSDPTEVRTPLPRPVAPGGSIVLRVRWRVVLPAAYARTGYAGDFAFVAQWFPKLAVLDSDGTWAHFPYHAHSEFYADFGRYDVRLTVPRGDVVGACGSPIDGPVHTPRGDRFRFVAELVHDFAWTSWRRFDETTERIAGIRVRVLSGPGMSSFARATIDVLRGAIPAFADRYGEYPYRDLTVVVPPPNAAGVGGMEYPTLITTGGAPWTPSSVHDVEYVTVHEFGHQYFYGLVASNESRWPFLDEGLTEYATGVVLGDLQRRDARIISSRAFELGFWAYQGGRAAAERSQPPVASAASDFATFGAYGGQVYRRTAAILRTLERTWGTGPTRRALHAYAVANRFRHPEPDDLLDAVRTHVGTDAADGFLRPALLSDADLDLTVEAAPGGSRSGAGGGDERFALRRVGQLRLPVEIEYRFADGTSQRRRVESSAARVPIDVPTHGSLDSIRIDPDDRIPLDTNTLNNGRRVLAGPPPALGGVARIATWVAALLRVVGP